jgi:hypothetical protein
VPGSKCRVESLPVRCVHSGSCSIIWLPLLGGRFRGTRRRSARPRWSWIYEVIHSFDWLVPPAARSAFTNNGHDLTCRQRRPVLIVHGERNGITAFRRPVRCVDRSGRADTIFESHVYVRSSLQPLNPRLRDSPKPLRTIWGTTHRRDEHPP